MQKTNLFHSHQPSFKNFTSLDTFEHPDLSPLNNPRSRFSAKPYKELEAKNPFTSSYARPIETKRSINFNWFNHHNDLLDGEDSSDLNRNYKDTDKKKFLAVSAQYFSLPSLLT